MLGVYVLIALFVLGMVGITYMRLSQRRKDRRFKDDKGLK